MTETELILIGVIGQTHALKGALKLRSIDDPKRLTKLERVFVASRGWFKVKKFELHDTSLTIQLIGISSLELAQKLIGLEVFAHESELPLEDDVFYYHDLVGCKVIDQNDLLLGVVKDVLDTGVQDLLVIARDDGDYLVPVQAPYIKIFKNLIQIEVFAGLLDKDNL